MSATRHVYLKIEKLREYSPVAPDAHDHHRTPVDCMRNHGHEDGTIPVTEVQRRTLDALVYREYTDKNFTIPTTAPLIAADINEPQAGRRIPGTVLYAAVGERLYVHVFNADDEPHSFHVHGVHYGIDSDGSWPFGVHQDDGNRSDAICPGKQWCYVFDLDHHTIGPWPFHDHSTHLVEAVNRGLFGGLVVRDPHCDPTDIEAPIFIHRLVPPVGQPLFDSGTLSPGDTFQHTFTDQGTYEYFCKIHPGMRGTIRVTAAGPMARTVTILDAPGRFDPDDVTIAAGGQITWQNNGIQDHTASDSSSAAVESMAINGRTFVGNTPTIVARTGQRIRWYVFNLDLGMMWHNFHLHGQRWKRADGAVDTQSIGPAESFVVDSVVPPVLLCPPPDECECEPQHGHDDHPPAGASGSHHHTPKKHTYTLQGDFLFHCHVEMHMMEGMAGLVRAVQEVELTEKEAKKICFHLPKQKPHAHGCPDVDHHGCGDKDGWERTPDAPIFVVHGAQLHTGRVLLFSGRAERNLPLDARLFNPATKTFSAAIPMPEDFFCSGHTFLADGRLLVIGGDAPGHTNNRAYIFTPDAINLDTGTFSATGSMTQGRWYPTGVRLADGRVLAFSGDGNSSVEVFNGATWQTIAGAARNFPGLYPGMHLLPTGEIFHTRTSWNPLPGVNTAYLTLTSPATGAWTDFGSQQFPNRQEGMSLVMIDTTVSPVRTRVFVFGGGPSGVATQRNPLSAEVIEFSGGLAGAAWQRLADMNNPRVNVAAVVLPDGKILIVGGCSIGNRNPGAVVLPTEIYDPALDTWTPAAPVSIGRQYHSVCVLTPDARVLYAGGEPQLMSAEVYTPGYLNRGPRPVVSAAPSTVGFGAAIALQTPAPNDVDAVVLIAPISVTHHTDAGQRYIKLPITSRTATAVNSQAPANGNIAPPGFYMLFAVNTAGVPSEARFIRVG
jgi:plastocyanin